MLASVYFNDKLRGVAVEVDSVAIERDLATKLRAVQMGAAEMLP